MRLESYAGGAVTQAAKLSGAMGLSSSCGAPPCCGAVPCSSLYGSASPVTPPPYSAGTAPQYPASPLPSSTMVQEYARTVPGVALQQPMNVQYPSNPQPMPVEVEGATITQPVNANVGWEGDRRVGVYSLETSPNVRIIGEDACGCPAGVDPCNDPCAKEESPRDKIENKLDQIKSQIVEDAEKVKDQNLWIKQVKEVIKHYERKIKAVNKDTSGVQAEIKRLFGLKKHYEDLLLQYELDRSHFKKVEQWHAPDEIVVKQVADHRLPSNVGTRCVEADTC